MKLLHDLDVICSYPLDPSLESVLHFVVEFQKSLPDLVARAHLQVRYSMFHLFVFILYPVSVMMTLAKVLVT